MTRVWILGGTTEGRLLADCCAARGIEAFVSVATEYGVRALREAPCLTVVQEAMGEERMEAFLAEERIGLVIDASHPYADQASENVRRACRSRQVEYRRVIRRQEEGLSGPPETGDALWVDSCEEAARRLAGTEGSVLLTTGSKALRAFAGLPGYRDRVYARVLPTLEALRQCEELGLRGKHVIAMQGPFSRALNEAMMRQLGIRYLVTKEAGRPGGFQDKIAAAAACSVTALVVRRPKEEQGMTAEAAMELLYALHNDSLIRGISPTECDAQPTERNFQTRPRACVWLIGVGMGGEGQMTLEARNALKRCQAVLGAGRMLKCAQKAAPGALLADVYRSDAVVRWLDGHPELERVGVALSGDPGFYSGAKGLLKALGEEPYRSRYRVEVLPGVSSVSYLCARLGIGWEDLCLMSVHGRGGAVAGALAEHGGVFCLTGGMGSLEEICRELAEAGWGEALVTVGECLSYPEERIWTRTAARHLAEGCETDSLAAVLIRGERKEKNESR